MLFIRALSPANKQKNDNFVVSPESVEFFSIFQLNVLGFLLKVYGSD